jgi:predicted AlkP superfamily pyrophosphatase or phosphodiesterase
MHLTRNIPALLFVALLSTAHAQTPHVLMISVDGMRPDYVTHADEHHLKLPTLRRFLREGAYADGVIGVLPTITHPSHTTLITGVWPAEHGIYNNIRFDPLLKNKDEWYWFASDIQTPTLWQAASAAGITTASIFWPVTVGARGIDYLIPAYPVRTSEDRPLLEAISRPVGYLERLEQIIGPLYIIQPVTVWDERLTQTAIALIHDKHPGFMTLHLVSLDSIEHATGPFSPQSNAAMEAIDAMIGRLIEAERAANPDAIVVVVSDHGFAATASRVNLLIPFAEAGLITLTSPKPNTAPTIASWKATIWNADGSAYVLLKDPNDAQMRSEVATLLDRLQQNPQYGIARILTHDQIVAEGGDPAASFMVALKPGFTVGEALQGVAVNPIPGTGTHGYTPDVPEMQSAFFALGPGIARRDVGTVDMRQIAPTIAGFLGITLPTAKQPPIHCRP